MTSARTVSLTILFALVALLGLSSLYVVYEGQHAVLLRLGKMVEDKKTGKPAVKGPGIHFKVPFINYARTFDTRIQTLDIDASRIVTAKKKYVLVDYYVKWRIDDLPAYYTSIGGNQIQAETLLEQIVNDGLRAEFGKRTIKEVVSGEKDEDNPMPVARGGRAEIMAFLRKQTNESSKDLGIQIIDVRIKRIDLPTEVSNAVFARMRAERTRTANEHRAEGKSVGEAIRAEADAKVTIILANAKSKSQHLRGEGDATAAKIYADAYNQNPEFFAFYRSINAYKDAFKNKQDMLVIKPDSQFFKYFNQANKGKRKAA